MTYNTLPYIATTLAGLEEVLEEELKQLGASETQQLTRAVAFSGTQDLIYKANLWSRTALQVLMNLSTAVINSPDDIYNHIMTIQWDKYFRPYDTFSVAAVVHENQFINNSLFAALKAKDAIVDQLRNKYGARPSVDKDNPTIIVNLHISKNNMSVAINSTGVPLFKRSYKKCAVASPLNEVLAAGIIKLSGWDKTVPLFDPFCGSGTILIEAAMMAANVAPGLYRNNSFAFTKWKSFNKNKWYSLQEDAKKAITYKIPPIYGSDISAKAVDYAKENINSAGFTDFIKVEQVSFGEFTPDIDDGFIISNPPYGVRTDATGLNDLYKLIGDTFKNQFKGFSCWIISSEKEAIDKIGLHACSKRKLFNGPLECKLMGYKMY